jgi:hypothetical protein
MTVRGMIALVMPLACAACMVSPARGQELTGFIGMPTDQLGVPGLVSGAEITPEGDLYTGWAEYEVLIGASQEHWNQPTRTQGNYSLPLYSSVMRQGPLWYDQSTFAVRVAGVPVAYDAVTVTNHSNVPRVADVALAVAYTRGTPIRGFRANPTYEYRYERPVDGQPLGFYDQPGQAFSPTFRYSVVGRDVIRNGVLLARGPAASGRVMRVPLLADTPTSEHAVRLFRRQLRAHGGVTYVWQIPLEAASPTKRFDESLDAVPLGVAVVRLRAMWASEEAGMMRVSVPEQKVSNTYDAAIVEILASRYESSRGWVQVSNKLQYQAFWIRDASLEIDALDVAGLHRQAGEDLGFLNTLQEPSGLFISRAGQFDGLGQALWILSRHAQLTGDPAFAVAQLQRLETAIGWLSAASALDPLGLLPASNPGDDEFAFGHITGADLWAAAGLRSAVSDARLAGRPDLVAKWGAIDSRFETSLDSAIRTAVARAGHIPPVLDSTKGFDWGNFNAAYPVQVLPANSLPVRTTVTWALRHMTQGLATYNHSLHDYLGFPIYETELEEGLVSHAVAGLYSELTHTTATDNGWEWGISPFGARESTVNLSPHGTFAAGYVELLRNLLVDEEPDGAVSLLGGASPAWLAPGEHITVTHAATSKGTIAFTERSTRRGERLTWTSDFRAPLYWTLPPWATHVHASGERLSGRVLRLSTATGSVFVSFAGHRPHQSYRLAVAELNRIYLAHHEAAPIVAAN